MTFTGVMRTSLALGAVAVSAVVVALSGCGTPMSPPSPQQGSATPDQGSVDPGAAQSRAATSAAFSPPPDSELPDAGKDPDAAPPPDAGPVCPTGSATCGGSATNLHTDSANCGVCGHACSGGAWCSGGVCWAGSQRASAVTLSQTVGAAMDEVSTSELSVVGDNYQFVAEGQSVTMHRLPAGVTTTVSSVLSPHATFEVSRDLFTDIGSAKTTFDFHVAESTVNPFAYVAQPDAPRLSHVYAYGLVDVSNPTKPTHVTGLSTSGNGITMTLPCDKLTQCASCPCTCGCYAFSFGSAAQGDAWSATAIDTVSETDSTVTCTTYAPEGVVAAFAK